jgi:hypothetical protein
MARILLLNHGESQLLQYKRNFPLGKLRVLDDFCLLVRIRANIPTALARE